MSSSWWQFSIKVALGLMCLAFVFAIATEEPEVEDTPPPAPVDGDDTPSFLESAVSSAIAYSSNNTVLTTSAITVLICLLAGLQADLLPNRKKQRRTPRVWPERSVVIYCPTWIPGQTTPWGPASVVSGLGGSEEAVVFLSQELIRRGLTVTVYNKCVGIEGDYDGVRYRPVSEFNIDDEFDSFILWRVPDPMIKKIVANRKVYWTHDAPACMLWASVLCGQGVEDYMRIFRNLSGSYGAHLAILYFLSTLWYWPKSVVYQFDLCVALTEYHASLLAPVVPAERMLNIGNGVFRDHFDRLPKDIPRDPHRIIYPVSYNRGLDRLLKMWPRIREQVPDATLELFYGWSSVYNKTQKRELERLVQQDGVTDHGKVGHEELLVEYLKAGIFAYPSTVTEAYSIATLKAVLCGTVPVVTNLGALTTVAGQHDGAIVVDPPNDDEKYLAALLSLLTDIDKQEDHRRRLAKTGIPSRFSWEQIAREWDEQVLTRDFEEARVRQAAEGIAAR